MIGICNLCGSVVVQIHPGYFGTRCLNCRYTKIHRAVGLTIESLNFSTSTSVYELSSRGALYKFLKGKFKNLYFSEYFDDVPLGLMKNSVVCQDVQNLLLNDESFNLVTSTEVFEHVPDDSKGFSEIYRVLKKGLFGLCYAMDGGYKGWNPYRERHLAIFVNCFLSRAN
ncbi:MAG: class I SAM-dependent methyltransferase [Microcystis sp. 49638_E5]|jgi:SAM-dependent methyltransferase|nr:class I SAM-dependent methyltransferase [Microcystis sp. 49638_E5]MCE2670931.1 class I SAM-dependent methyltransferase [Microcystis sp. 49638_E5]MCZ8053563.1 class I SAM-dependent methyltransferase [Microcystis sp. LE19-12.2C]